MSLIYWTSTGPCSAHRGRVILEPVSPRSSGDRALASGARCGSSNLPGGTTSPLRSSSAGAWRSGSAPGLGPGGRQFKPARPDQIQISYRTWATLTPQNSRLTAT